MTRRTHATSWPPLSPTSSKEILNAAPVMLRRLDPAQHCDWTNSQWLIFGARTPEQERGLGWTGNVHPDDLSTVLSKLITAASTRTSVHLHYRLRRANGDYGWVEERGGVLWKASGFAGHVLVCTEVSEQMQEVFDLQMKAERSRHDAFAHRMKNTMQLIMSTLQLEAREAGEHGAILRHAARRIHGIITVQERADLLDREGCVDLIQLLSEVTAAVINGQSALRLEFSAPDLPVLLATGRASTLALVVTEAMINSVKHSTGRGATRIRVELTCRQHELTIEISDDGLGFPARLLKVDGGQMSIELLLFRSMAAQARAQLTLVNRGGAVVQLRLSLD
jgi:two-component sensor histidine kinase